MNYKAKVNNTVEFNVTSDDLSKTDVIKTSGFAYHILQNNTSYQAEIVSSNFNKKSYDVYINNTIYNVTISNDLDILLKDMGFSVGSSKHINSVKAPMPGLILDINVKVGQEVKEDDALLILEAMKMENAIAAPKDGHIKTIHVSPSNSVDKGALMIEME